MIIGENIVPPTEVWGYLTKEERSGDKSADDEIYFRRLPEAKRIQKVDEMIAFMHYAFMILCGLY